MVIVKYNTKKYYKQSNEDLMYSSCTFIRVDPEFALKNYGHPENKAIYLINTSKESIFSLQGYLKHLPGCLFFVKETANLIKILKNQKNLKIWSA